MCFIEYEWQIFFSFRYFIIINDILTSVEKTRDSLMKLKKKIASASIGSSGSSTSVSDEDKIRLQLQLDVLEFANEVSLLFYYDTFHYR